MPRAPQKAVLANTIWTRLPPDIAGPTGEVQHVLDGGALLHRITWPHGFPTYQQICALYCVAKLWARHRSLRWLPHSVHQVHNTSTAHRQQSQNRGHLHRRYEVDYVEGCLPLERRQQTELHRHVESLPAACWMPHRALGGGCRPVDFAVLVADDIDLVILLCYYADPDGFDLFMQCSTRGTTKKNRIWDIKVTQSELGADICNDILFIHAIFGCDTTSRLYGLGKGLSLKRFITSALFREG